MEPVGGVVSVAEITINVRGASGSGPTALAAFDDALCKAGVSNYNLIRLSSVIPPNTVVRAGGSESPTSGVGVSSSATSIDLRDTASTPGVDRWGDRLYAVWAYQSAQLLGQEAWAGVAWLQSSDDGRGLFVEHEGGSEAQVREELQASLTSIATARGMQDLPHESLVVGARCDTQPVCALVIAPFVSARW